MSQIIHGSVPIEGDFCLSYVLYSPSSATVTSKTDPSNITLLVFVNGLRTLAADWDPIAVALQSATPLYLLAYDRWNCGESDALPPTRSSNDISTSARDLGLLLSAVTSRHNISLQLAQLILVGSSIGCCIIRLFLEEFAEGFLGSPYGVILLDSYICNTDFVSLFPPRTENEPEPLTRTRDVITNMFYPTVPNQEGLDRSNAAQLLPYANKPSLKNDPLLLVVAHDAEYNVDEMVLQLNIDKEVYLQYVQRAWDDYNNGLKKLSHRSRLLTAENSAHFIYKDRPDLVVQEIQKMTLEIRRYLVAKGHV